MTAPRLKPTATRPLHRTSGVRMQPWGFSPSFAIYGGQAVVSRAMGQARAS